MSSNQNIAVPEFTPAGDRNMKSTRIAALAAQGVNLAETIKRNTLKEEVVLEYVENFKRQFTQLYPDRQQLLLSPKNEAGVSKFVCTAIRPTQVPVKELYDAAACASFVANYIQYEPLEPPTEVPEVLPSPDLVLQQRVGDCLDMAVLLASLLIGNGLDAYVVIGTAPKWVTLKEEDKTVCPTSLPADAVDRAAHTSPDALGLTETAAAVPAGKPPAAGGAAGSTNRYKLPPPSSLESTLMKDRAKKEEDAKRKAEQETSLDSDAEDETAELSRLRKGYREVVEAKATVKALTKPGAPLAELPDKDPHHGQRVHAWVLVRARDKGGRRVFAPFFLEPSTGTQFATDASPYLSVEAVFNHKNYFVNMQAQSLLPVQDAAVPVSPRDVMSGGAFGPGNALSDNFRAALSSRGAHVRGGGGSIAVAAVVATLDGPLGAAMQGEAGRPDMLSPYMATLVATKAMADKAGSKELNLDFNFHPGAPKLAGVATQYTLNHPLPAAAMQAPASAAAPAAAKASSSEDAKEGGQGEGGAEGAAAEGGEGNGEGSAGAGAEGGAPAEGAAAEGAPTDGAAEGGDGAAGGAAATEGAKEGSRPPSAAPVAPAGGTAQDRPQTTASKPGSAASRSSSRGQSRSSSRMRGQRAPSRGRGGLPHIPGSMASWRVLLSKQTAALQAQAAEIMAAAAAARSPTVADLRWDLFNSDDWEYLLIPYEPAEEDGVEEEEGEAPGAGAEAAGAGAGAAAGEGKTAEGGDGGENGDGGSDSKSGSRSGSAARARSATSVRKPSDKYAKATIEEDGQHLLDLPASWCPKLNLDRHVAKEPLGEALGHALTGLHYRAKLDMYDMHSQPSGRVTRHTQYADSSRKEVVAETTVFNRRRDNMYKRVVRPRAPVPVIEEHFLRRRAAGLAMITEQLGKTRSYYYFPGSRVDALLLRVEQVGHKFAEWFSATPNRLWYRSVTLVSGSAKSAEPAAPQSAEEGLTISSPSRKGDRDGSPRDGEYSPGSPMGSPSPPGTAATTVRRPATHQGASRAGGQLTVEVDVKVEAVIRKMAEKYRRNPAVPYHQDPAKIVYNLAEGTITVTYHAPPGRLTRQVRLYNRATGEMKLVDQDALDKPILLPFDTDNDYRRLLTLEKECHAAVRAAGRAALELRQLRAWECAHADTERTVYETALERAKAGAALEEESERKTEDLTAEPDVLLPFLIASRADDPSNPAPEAARKADREARLAFKERLDGRSAAIQRRLDEEREKLLRKQQAFSRNRDHTESEEAAFEEYVGQATFRIAILEQRLGRQDSIKQARLAEFDARLRADTRLMSIYNPMAWKAKQELEAE